MSNFQNNKLKNSTLISWAIFLSSCAFYSFSKVYSITLMFVNFGYLVFKRKHNFTLLIQLVLGTCFLIIIPFLEKENNFEVFTKLINTIIRVDLRQSIMDYFDQIHSVEVASFLKLLLLNFKSNESSELYNKLINLSVVHMIVVSGFHINLICGLFNKVPKCGKYLSLFAALFLSYLNNFSVSITRSLLFYLFGIFKRTKDNKHPWTIISICLIAPNSIYNIGLCMSLMCIRGLNISNKLKIKNSTVNMFISSLLATIYSLPFVATINQNLSLWAIFVSAILTPFFVIIYFLSLILSWFNNLDVVIIFFINVINFFADRLSDININVPIKWLDNQIVCVFYIGAIEGLFYFTTLKKEEYWKLERLPHI